MDSQLYALILAGGSGTRFWPLSRKANPKQLLALVDSEPIINTTINRLSGLVEVANVGIICGPSLYEPTRAITSLVGVERFIIEPRARNTAPAILLGATVIAREDPSAVLAFLPSDHVVLDEPAFRATVESASDLARQGHIVTLGIHPTRPETGFGYIKRKQALSLGFAVDRFVEKPDIKTAESYLDSGDYFWNAGIFVTTADTLFAELKAQHPEASAAFETALSAPDSDFVQALADAFDATPATSIDYAIMENAKQVAVIPADFGWSDVGHWAALPEVMASDEHGNITRGDVVAVRTRNSILVNYAADRVLAVSDMDAVVAVQTQDSTMIVPRDRAQSVRDIVRALNDNGLERYL